MTGRTIVRLAITAAAACAIGAAAAPLASADTTAPSAPTVKVGADLYSNMTFTVSNPNTDGSVCGLYIVKTSTTSLPTQVYPTGWSAATASWTTFPNAVTAGATETYTVSHMANGNYAYYAGCGNATAVSAPVTQAFHVNNAVPAGMLGSTEDIFGPIINQFMNSK